MEKRHYQLSDVQTTERSIAGYAAVFNSASQPMKDMNGRLYKEYIRPGAFRNLDQNIWMYWDHDYGKPMGSTFAKTLTLSADQRGIPFLTNDLADTSYTRDAKALLAKGEPLGMSIGFHILKEKWNKGDDMPVRELLDLDLAELSITANPAYTSASVNLRSIIFDPTCINKNRLRMLALLSLEEN